MPDTTSQAGASHAEDPKPVTHLALLLGEPDHISELTAALRYEGLAVVGASPVGAGEEGPDPRGLAEYLSGVSKSALSDSGIEKVHVLQFPGVGVDAEALVVSIRSEYDGVEVVRVPVETEKGARAYFEEAHSLVPESEEILDEGEKYIQSLLRDPSFRKTLREEAENLRSEQGLPEFPGLPGLPDPFALTPESGSASGVGSGDREQGTLEGLERVEPKTLLEAKVYLEERNDSLLKEVDVLSRDNRELRGRVVNLEDRVTGLLRILDKITNAFDAPCPE